MIVINGRFLTQRLTGVHRFAYEITCALWRRGEELVVVAPADVCEQYECPFPVVRTRGKGSHLWEQMILPHYVRRHYRGALLITWTGLSPLSYRHAFYTIHDVSYLENPRWFSRSYYWFYRLLTPLAARRAERVLTVSEFSKRELIKYLHLPADQITVVYNAVDTMPPGQRQEGERYILSVCSMDPRKNLPRLVEAFAGMQDTDCKLYLVGGTNSVFRHAGMETDERVRLLGYVSGARLSDLYRNALAFVSASVYEGFGIPNVEAMWQDCPLAVSDIEVYHEVCGDAAVYFDPYNPESIRTTLRQLIGSEALREQLIEKGRQRCRLFSWDKSAATVAMLIHTT